MELSAVEATRRSCSDSTPPEFEFWKVGNHPSSPQPHLLTADELFVDGVLLPLHLLSLVPAPQPEPHLEPGPDPSSVLSASICSAAPPSTGSRRWKDIFKGTTGGAADLNINIWPFSRSHSAGNGGAGGRPPVATAVAIGGRKASSAPCSRSNSRGESSKPVAARRWAASPGRAGLSGGVHLGRTIPVWKLRRPALGLDKTGPKDKAAGGGRKGSGGPRVLSLNVQTCIGYRSQVSCRGKDNDGVAGAVRSGGDSGDANGSLFNLRTLFSKKVY